MDGVGFMLSQKYFHFASSSEAVKFGIRLVRVSHGEPMFPTDAVIVEMDGHRLWYSPDIKSLGTDIIPMIRDSDLVIFDSTFLREEWQSGKFASKFNHLAVEFSAPVLSSQGVKVIYSHINHSESDQQVSAFLEKYGYRFASDGLEIET
jgi:hypothetical protein